jgi:hypothetical protein
MENNPLESSEAIQSMPSMQITPESVVYLSTTAKWTKFMAIIGFVITGFLLLLGAALFFFYAAIGRGMGNTGPLSLVSPSLLGGIYFIIAFIYLWPVIYLNNFSNYATRAVRTSDSVQLTKAFRNLKQLFQFIGILTILVLVIYLIAIIGLVVAGAMLI